MADAIGQYTERARGAELALFFYAGHGAQLNGENYLLPVDAAVENEADLKLKAIDLSSLQDALPEAHANVIILDACRNNPFAGTIAGHRGIGASRGLTPMDPKTGSEIVFATKPNSVAADGSGRNSPFTAALLRHIGARGLEIRQMISRVRRDVIDATNGEQVPWDNSSLVDDLYLAGMEFDLAFVRRRASDRACACAGSPGPVRDRFPRRLCDADSKRVHGADAARSGSLRGPMGGRRNLP